MADTIDEWKARKLVQERVFNEFGKDHVFSNLVMADTKSNIGLVAVVIEAHTGGMLGGRVPGCYALYSVNGNTGEVERLEQACYEDGRLILSKK